MILIIIGKKIKDYWRLLHHLDDHCMGFFFKYITWYIANFWSDKIKILPQKIFKIILSNEILFVIIKISVKTEVIYYNLFTLMKWSK